MTAVYEDKVVGCTYSGRAVMVVHFEVHWASEQKVVGLISSTFFFLSLSLHCFSLKFFNILCRDFY